MNEDEINRAIAEHLGWEDCLSGFGIETRYKGTPSEVRVTVPYPRYCNDLNAMYEAENTLENHQLWMVATALAGIAHVDAPITHSTARQRAEAFLRVVGKWRGEE
jgi:hypothetical protein